jgi:mono/diheme cytochrome c family protein
MKSAFVPMIVAGLCFAGPLDAQTVSLGEFEYRNSCAVCHGEDGTGNGPFAGMMEIGPVDLTVLQRNNGGVFPVERLYKAIDGSEDVKAHGMRDMPVWGTRYIARIDNDPAFDYSPDERRRYARNRILALIEYLSTIQAE